MRFDREAWVKLFRAESPQHRLMSLGARTFRDFLLRFADDATGSLLAVSSNVPRDLCRVIGADSSDVRQVRGWINELLDVGFLSVSPGGAVTIVNFVEAQMAKSQNAERQARYRARRNGDSVTSNATSNTDSDATDNVTGDPQEKRGEEKRGEESPPTPQDTPGPCPLGELLPLSVVDELAGFFGVDHATIRDAEREFKGYWTVGRGAGRRFNRGTWIAKCREQIRRRFEEGTLKARPKAGEGSAQEPVYSP